MPRSVRHVRTVELHHYEHQYNELTDGEQILSLRFANICIQIIRANNEQPSRMCQANFVGSKSPHSRRPVPSLLNLTRDPSIPSSNGFIFPGLQAHSPGRGGYGRSVIEQKSLV